MTPGRRPDGQKIIVILPPELRIKWMLEKLTNFGHLTMIIIKTWPWSWSKMTNFDRLTMENLTMENLTMENLIFWPCFFSMRVGNK